MGRARASLAALEADVVAEVARREGDAATEEFLRRDQKRSRREARKAVKVAEQLGWAPRVADKLASGEITPEAAGLILDADAETPVDQRKLLAAAETEPDDVFRRTLKEHVNERTSEQELEERRAAQRRRRRASISEQPDGMFHLFAQFDPLVGNQVRAALVAKSDALFRGEDPKQRPTPPQRFADALADLVATSAGTSPARSDTTESADSGNGVVGGRGGGGPGRARSDTIETPGGTGSGGRTSSDTIETPGGSGSGGRARSDTTETPGGTGSGAPVGVELIVLADYDLVHERITNARLTDGTRLTEAETLAVACDAKILPGIFNKHTGNILLARSQRKVPKWLRKQLIARDRGCIGCRAHHQICETHHLDHWADGGETTLENTCLLCWRCHHIRLHLNGEEITRHPDGTLTLAPPSTPSGDMAERPPPQDKHRPHRAPTTGTCAPEESHRPPSHSRDRASPSPTAGTGSAEVSGALSHNGHPPHPAPTAGADSTDPSLPPPNNGHRGSRHGTGRRGAPSSPRPPATLF